MASFLNKIRVATAMQTRNVFDLSHVNLTTQAFYSCKPVLSLECMPNGKYNINYSNFTRLLPLEEPMLAHCNIVTRAFFVPYRVVWPMFTSFITGTSYSLPTSTVFPKNVPYIYWSDFRTFFVSHSTIVTSGSYDFYDVSLNRKYRFTPYARRCYDILLNLGYSFNLSDNVTAGGTTDIKFSMLPLLSYIRVYYDWMQNTNYDNFSGIARYFNVEDNYHFTSGILDNLFIYVTTIQYRSDIFTSAFDKPSGPNVNANDVTFPLQSYNSSSTTTEEVDRKENEFEGTPALKMEWSRFTQNGLNILHALTDYYQRLRGAGSRALDRYLAEFGVKLSDERLQRSSYLGGSENEIKVMDVMSNASTDSADLGDYAGKGVGDVSGHFSYETQEFGHIILISYIEPRQSVVQGYDRCNLHLNRFDFFSGDMDAIGYQAISKGEVFSDYKGQTFSAVASYCNPNGVFGYSGRFYEYKVARDKLTGNFRVPSVNAGYHRWHLFRLAANGNDVTTDLADINPVSGTIVHNLDFTTASAPHVYNRVFGSQIDIDAFFSKWMFSIKASLPAKPLYEQYEYASHGTKEVLPLGGTRVTG